MMVVANVFILDFSKKIFSQMNTFLDKGFGKSIGYANYKQEYFWLSLMVSW